MPGVCGEKHGKIDVLEASMLKPVTLQISPDY